MNYQLPVNVSAILGRLSYGIVGLNIVKELDKLGLNVCLFPIGIEQETYQENSDLINKCLKNAEEYNRRATSLVINQQFALHTHVGKNLQIGFPIFELNRFTPRELVHLRNQDKLVVCSQWAKDILLENKVLNDLDIHVVPLGVDQTIFEPRPFILTFAPCHRTAKFISIGKWEVRKGHYELLDYFESAFTPDDDVELTMVTGSLILEQRAPDEVRKWKDYYRSSPMASKIKIVDWAPSQKDIANLLRGKDALISLSRAEGWNLPVLEAMSCGLEIGVTNCAAHTEFCTTENSTLFSVGDLELAVDNVFFNGQSGGQWYSLTEDTKESCVNFMREIYKETKERGNLIYNRAGMETAKKFSWEAAALKLSEIL